MSDKSKVYPVHAKSRELHRRLANAWLESYQKIKQSSNMKTMLNDYSPPQYYYPSRMKDDPHE